MDRRVISIDGVFDAEAATPLRKCIAALAPSHPLSLDFTQARNAYDLALAIAHGLANDGIAARYQGLLDHQERLPRNRLQGRR